MPTIESIQHKLDRVRPPRVQITYDVQIGDAIERIELPFVFGIIADLDGTQDDTTPVKDRKFVDIDRDNFNQIMSAIKPTLEGLSVTKTIPEADGSASKEPTFAVDKLIFTQMADFDPANVVQNVSELQKLFAERQHLRDLQAKLDGNDDLRQALLTNIVHPTNGAGK